MRSWKYNRPFRLKFNKTDGKEFRKGDVLNTGFGSHRIIILKIETNTYWHRFLAWLRIVHPITDCEVVFKVKMY
jgi:hypothetical protein